MFRSAKYFTLYFKKYITNRYKRESEAIMPRFLFGSYLTIILRPSTT